MGMGKQKFPIEDRIAQDGCADVGEREFALIRNDWEDSQLRSSSSGYKRLYPSPEKEKEYWQVHDAAINIWEMMMGGTFRRAVRLLDPLDRPEEVKTVVSWMLEWKIWVFCLGLDGVAFRVFATQHHFFLFKD
eukprot:symbB.v1.2.034877.t1/scaffold4581.1/size37751/1